MLLQNRNFDIMGPPIFNTYAKYKTRFAMAICHYIITRFEQKIPAVVCFLQGRVLEKGFVTPALKVVQPLSFLDKFSLSISITYTLTLERRIISKRVGLFQKTFGKYFL